MSDPIKEYTVHMIGNAHIDPIWLWRMQEGYEEVISTCRSALDRMKETQEFIFTRSSAATYKWIEENEPKMFEEIRQRVKEGRWNIVNGWWVQPDCNIPCGESFVRHALYGKRYFMERFGVDVKVGYNVDSFGHCATLPQILKKSGLDYYVFFRPDPNEKTLPGLFYWESPDHTRVLTCRPPHHYNTGPGEIEKRIYQAYERTPPNVKDVMCFYGVGNHGGGPTKQNIESIRKTSAREEYPTRRQEDGMTPCHKSSIYNELTTVLFSSPDAFFEKVIAQTQDFPVVAEELQYHSRGCYTAYSDVKRNNRFSECLLMTAEKFPSIAHWMLGSPYPQANLTEAWQNTLFNQFHDILAGTSIKPAYDEDVNKLYADLFKLGEDALKSALESLTSAMDLPNGENVVVFNPMSWQRKEGVEIDVGNEKIKIVDPYGKEIAYQLVDKGKLVFIADVPSLGWASYRILPSEDQPEFDTSLKITQTKIENSFYSIELDPETGFIKQIFDKIRGVEMLSDPGNVPIVIDDPSDTWSHGVSAFRNEIGKFLIDGEVEIVETGPIRATLKVKSRCDRNIEKSSQIETLITLWGGVPRIEFQMTVDWHEKHKMLKIAFPINVDEPIATYEVPYGNVVRDANGNEEPHQFWIDVTGSNGQSTYGVSLINNCKYGSDIKGNEMRLSVLRSPIYAFHDPAVVDPNKTYDYTDQGIQILKYALVSHGRNWLANSVRQGFSFNYPLIPMVVEGHEGKLSKIFSFISLAPDNLIITTLKKAEDDDSLILRFYETSGKDGTASLKFSLEDFSAQIPFGKYEIKSLKLMKLEGKIEVKETDLLE